MNYSKEIRKDFGKKTYQEEIDWIVTNPRRNKIIQNLTMAQEGNTLVLFQFVEKHGKIIYEMLKEVCKDRKVFFVFGGTDTDTREEIRALTELEKDALIMSVDGELKDLSFEIELLEIVK